MTGCPQRRHGAYHAILRASLIAPVAAMRARNRYGVDAKDSNVTATATTGTMTLEFWQVSPASAARRAVPGEEATDC